MGFLIGGRQEPINLSLGILLFWFVIKFFAHSPFMNHLAGNFTRHIEIAGSAVGS